MKVGDLITALQEGERAKQLLERIWLSHGPYQQHPIDSSIWQEVNNFFKFDDGE